MRDFALERTTGFALLGKIALERSDALLERHLLLWLLHLRYDNRSR